MSSTSKRWPVERVACAQTRPLRAAVLRPNWPLETVFFRHEDAPCTIHLGVFDPENRGQLIGTTFLLPEAQPDHLEPQTAWQLRGMAVLAPFRGQGVGSALLEAALETAREEGADVLWCKARQCAFDFYGRAGFGGVGEVFEVPDLGPHQVMVRSLR